MRHFIHRHEPPVLDLPVEVLPHKAVHLHLYELICNKLSAQCKCYPLLELEQSLRLPATEASWLTGCTHLYKNMFK